jgi:integrase
MKQLSLSHLFGGKPVTSIKEARLLAQQLLIALGTNDCEADSKLTVCELFEKYMQVHGSKKRTAKRMRQLFNRHIKTRFGFRNASTIKGQEIVALHDDLGESIGHPTANRVIEVVRAAYNKGVKRGLVATNPCLAVTMFPLESRDRYLSDKEELDRFLAALSDMRSKTFQNLIRTCLWTGARIGSVQAMEWEQVDFNLEIWTIPKRNSKSGKPVVIPLIDEAQAAILAQRGKHPRWVFPGRGNAGHVVNPARAWKRLIDKARIENLHPHDLRRTMGSWMANTGSELQVIQKGLGHSSLRATHIYARLKLEPVREGMAKAAAAMLQKDS